VNYDELERIWQEAVVALIKVLCRHSPGVTEKDHKILNQHSRSPGRDLSLRPPEYEEIELITRPGY
jgi:hypothetical protein